MHEVTGFSGTVVPLSAGGAAQPAKEVALSQCLAGWGRVSSLRSVAKLSLYFAICAALVAAILLLRGWLPILLCQVLLGLMYAHGLELTHECLHGSMFRSARLNRLFGFVTGLPMLVSFTHYKYQHFHHHRYVGTKDDKELFDYREDSLRNPLRLLGRAVNLSRIPTFFTVLFGMINGRYPEIFGKMEQRRTAPRQELFLEYLVLAAVFVVALGLTVSGYTKVFLLVWFIPWLAFGELFHFLIELPEHLGRDRTKKNIYINSRSYTCNSLWAYIVNGNNFHVEHHLYPQVTIHNLGRLNERLDAEAHHTAPSYLATLKQVFAKSTEVDMAPQEIAS